MLLRDRALAGVAKLLGGSAARPSSIPGIELGCLTQDYFRVYLAGTWTMREATKGLRRSLSSAEPMGLRRSLEGRVAHE